MRISNSMKNISQYRYMIIIEPLVISSLLKDKEVEWVVCEPQFTKFVEDKNLLDLKPPTLTHKY